jgi:hypothetical protein
VLVILSVVDLTAEEAEVLAENLWRKEFLIVAPAEGGVKVNRQMNVLARICQDRKNGKRSSFAPRQNQWVSSSSPSSKRDEFLRSSLPPRRTETLPSPNPARLSSSQPSRGTENPVAGSKPSSYGRPKSLIL